MLGTNSQTVSKTDASCGRRTSATDECQSCNSSPSKTYTCNILLDINVYVLTVKRGLELMHLVDVELV